MASCEHIPSFVFHESRVTQLLCVHERARRRSDAVTLFWACSRGGWVVAVQSGCTYQDRARSGTTKGTGLGRTGLHLIPSTLEDPCKRFSLLCESFWVRKWGCERWHLQRPARAPESVCVPRRQSGEKSRGKWPTLSAASISIARLGLFKVHISHRCRCQWTLQQFHFPLQGRLLWHKAPLIRKKKNNKKNKLTVPRGAREDEKFLIWTRSLKEEKY